MTARVKEFYRLAMEEGVAGGFVEFYPQPLNMWFEVQLQPGPEGLVVFFRDVTERKEREARLEDEQALVEAVYKSTPVALALLDRETLRFLNANDKTAEILGVAKEEILGLGLDGDLAG